MSLPETLAMISDVAAIIFATAAVMIAVAANRISSQSQRLAEDKHVFEWSRGVLGVVSEAVSLRFRDSMEHSRFDAERRRLQARLYALRDEGAVFLVKDYTAQKEHEALACVQAIAEEMKHKSFRAPDDMSRADRGEQAAVMRGHANAFVRAVQGQVGAHWLERKG